MQPDPGLIGPLQYSQGWMWAGLALLAAVLGWYCFVFLSTRQRRPAPPARFTPPSDLHDLKEAYLQRFARDVSGLDAPRMTLAELHVHPLPGIAEAVSRIYPGEFGVEPLPPLMQSAETARQAVWQWN